MSSTYSAPPELWFLSIVCVLAVAMLWWLTLGMRRFRRWRGLRRRIASGLPGVAGAEGPAVWQESERAAMRQAIAQACATILESARHLHPAHLRRDRRDGLYITPWFLFMGDEQAQVDALMGAARTGSSLTGRNDAAEAETSTGRLPCWRWHVFPKMAAIAMRADLIEPCNEANGPALWYEALLELTDRRPRLPLNGFVLCTSIAGLHHDEPEATRGARVLGARLAEAIELLRLHVPVYLVITGLDGLPGFDRFRAALPEGAWAQAFGHRFEVAAHSAPGDELTTMRSQDAVGTLVRRLHALRLGLLRGSPEPVDRAAIHGFFEQLLTLMPRLETLIDGLFHSPGGPRRAQWRGLYFAASGSASAGSTFVNDLFEQLLPADQPLAHN